MRRSLSGSLDLLRDPHATPSLCRPEGLRRRPVIAVATVLTMAAALLATTHVVIAGPASAASTPQFGGTWNLDDTCTSSNCAGEHFFGTLHINQCPGSASFSGDLSGVNAIAGTQSGGSVKFSDSGGGYVAQFQVALSGDGQSFTGSYTDNGGGTGTTQGTRTASTSQCTEFSISGTLTSHNCSSASCSTTSQGVPGVTVDVASNDGGGITTSGISDGKGNWSVKVPSGGYRITPAGDGWSPAYQDKTVTNGDVPNVNFSECQSQQATGESADTVSWGGAIAWAAAASAHCTHTGVTCGSTYWPDPVSCLIVVQDIVVPSTERTRPAGTAYLDFLNKFPFVPASSACQLQALPGRTDASYCTVQLVLLQSEIKECQISGVNCKVAEPKTTQSYQVAAAYTTPTSNHLPSQSKEITIMVRPPFKGPNSIKQTMHIAGVTWYRTGEATGIIGLAATPLGGAGAPVATLGAIEAAIGDLTDWLSSFLKDPPVPDYKVVAVPRLPRTPDIPAGNTAVDRGVRKLLANALQIHAVAETAKTTIDRADTAATAGDLNARNAQIMAAATYLNRLAGLFSSEIALQRRVAAALRSAGLGTISVSTSQLDHVQGATQLPHPFARIVGMLTVIPNETAQLRKALAGVRVSTRVNVAALLTSSRLIKDEDDLVSVLRTFAKDPSPAAFPLSLSPVIP